MLSLEEDVEAHALFKQGWNISQIARHLGRDRKTIRDYLSGKREPGVRVRSVADPFDEIVGYAAQRLADDPHVWSSALYDEVVALGYPRAYSTFTRQLRQRRLRPACPACSSSGPGVPTIEIEHPAGAETQWDWVELPEAPWLDGGTADLLVGSLAYSSMSRGTFAEATDQPHLFDAIDRTCAALGGITRRWRFDRMGTVVAIGTDRLLASFAAFAKHHGVAVDICPARRAKRKGVVEKNIDFITRRWWRTANVATLEEAQRSLDAFCATIGDARPRHDLDGRPSTVAALAQHERLAPLPPTRFPTTLHVTRKVAANATVAYRGNHYSVDPALVGATVEVRVPIGAHQIEIVDPATGLLARHRLVAPGLGQIVRDGAHAIALEHAVLAAFTTDKPCRRKANRPPSQAAQALAAQLRDPSAPGDAVVIDLASWARHAPEGGR
jgi:transposase